MTIDDREALLDDMYPIAMDLVVAVHDMDQEATHRLLEGRPNAEKDALVIALASLVPDDEALTTLLAWTRPDGPVSARQAASNLAQVTAAASRGRRRSSSPRNEG